MTPRAALPVDALAGHPLEAARRILGCTLLVDGVGGRIVEVEAYAPDEPASHAFRGRTARNAAMFGLPGTLYVYRSHGLHWCANVVCGPAGVGAAVLVRALVPEHGRELIAARRAGHRGARDWCRGPGRLCQALAIDRALDAAPLGGRALLLAGAPAAPVVATPRIGISRAVELPWRLVEAGSQHASGARTRAPAPG